MSGRVWLLLICAMAVGLTIGTVYNEQDSRTEEAEMMHKLTARPMEMLQSPQPIRRYTWDEYIIEISHSEHRGYGFMIIKDCGDGRFPIWAASDGYASAGECDSKAQRMIAQSREG